MLKSTDIRSGLWALQNIQQDHGRLGINGEFEIEVLVQEDIGRRVDAPDKPTEAGYNITDNATLQPLTLALKISSNQWNWRDQRRALENYCDRRIPLQYYSPIDKKIYRNVVIESLNFKADVKQSTGFTADLKIKRILVASASQSTFEVAADKQGTTPQTSVTGVSSEGSPGEDNLEGKAFSSDGILWRFNNRGDIK